MKIISIQFMLALSLSVLLSSALLSSAPLLAQTMVQSVPPDAASFDENHQKARAKNPAGLKFTIDLGGRTLFHRGEIIPVHLHFSSDAPLGYKLDSRNYDRVGRLNLTDFFITDRPQDTPDPLGDYFREGVISFGGLSAIPQVIGPKTQTISQTLNEYLRFDKAGHYRLYVLSFRLFPTEKQFGGLFGGTPAASEVIEFDIAEGEEWAQNRAREIQAILSAAADTTAPETADKNAIPYGPLASELRYLDTPLSRRLMIANYGGPQFKYDGAFRFGLIGTRDKSDAVAAMRAHLQNPDGAVSSGFLQVLTTLIFLQSNPPKLPRYPHKAVQGSEELKQYQAIAKEREQKRSDIARALLNDLGRFLPAKHGTARAITLVAAIEGLGAATELIHGANSPKGELALPTLRRQLIVSWNDLPRETQTTLLGYRWPLIRDSALLPLLMRANDAPLRVNPNQSDNFEERRWRSLLLLRINQLSPAAGRKAFLAEMGRVDPRVDAGILLDLSGSVPPTLEIAWLRHLRDRAIGYHDSIRIAQLVARYASPQIAAPLKTWLDKKPPINRDIRAPLLAYFARVRPGEIGAMLEADIAAHKEPIFETIGAFWMNESVETVAGKYLQSANRYLAADAVLALSAYGSANVEAALWARLKKWHAGLQGKTLDNQQIEFETVLVQALALMPGVQTKRTNLEKLRALCWSSQARERLSAISYSNNGYGVSEIRYHPSLFNHYAWSFGRNRNGYWSLSALTQKLRQFPRGTTFSFHIEGIEAAPDAKVIAARLELWLQRHGYTLKIANGFD
jgi:hypothetical protein